MNFFNNHMCSVNYIFALLILSISQSSFGLVSLPEVEDNDILKTEDVIRSTTNTLFFSLGLIKSQNPRLKHYTLVHNYFVSLTLQDYDNLKEISKLTRVDKTSIDIVTAYLIAVINEITNGISSLNQEELTSFEEYSIDNELKKKSFINAFYDEQDIDKRVLNILEDETNTNYIEKTTLFNQSSSKEDSEYIFEEKKYWRDHKTNNGRRLYNAKSTKIKHFGFMASVEIFNRFQCAGSIIKSDLIITAASCLQLAHNNRFFRENPPFLTVRVGSSYFEVGGEVISVMEIYFHPSYVPQTLHHNIALMRLQRRLKFKKKAVKKIDIDTDDINLAHSAGRITILGWGAKSESNVMHSSWESKLRYAKVDLYDLRECQSIYSKEYVTHKNFCAGYMSRGSGACNRDVGGPGIAHGKLVGIISFGAPVCGTPDAPTVFVKVGYYYDWIDEIMNQDVPYIKQRTTLKPSKYTYGKPGSPPTIKLTPITTKKIEEEIKVVTAAFIPEKQASTRSKKQLLRELLKTMSNENEIKEYFEAFKILRMKEDPKTTQKITQKTIYNNYTTTQVLATYSSTSHQSKSTKTSQFNKRITKTDSTNNTNAKPSKQTTGIVDYSNEGSEYLGFQMENLNVKRLSDVKQVKPAKYANTIYDITQYVIPVTNPVKKLSKTEDVDLQNMEKTGAPTYENVTGLLRKGTDMNPVTKSSKQSLNAEDKKMQNIILQFMNRSSTTTNITITNFVKVPTTMIPLTTLDKQALTTQDHEIEDMIFQLMVESGVTKNKTITNATSVLKGQEYNVADFEKDDLSIFSENETMNETLRGILTEYVMTLFSGKEPKSKMVNELASSSSFSPNPTTTLKKNKKIHKKPLFTFLAKTTNNYVLDDGTDNPSIVIYRYKQNNVNLMDNNFDERSTRSTANYYTTSQEYLPTTTQETEEYTDYRTHTVLMKTTTDFGRKHNPNIQMYEQSVPKGFVNKVELTKYMSNDDIDAVIKKKKKSANELTTRRRSLNYHLTTRAMSHRILTRFPRRDSNNVYYLKSINTQ